MLLRNLGEDAVKLLKTTNAIIAGGAITSIFTGAEINDYDIYFRSKEDIVTFIRNSYNEEGDPSDESEIYPLPEHKFLDLGSYEFVCNNHTQRSISITHNGLNLQLIHFDFFEDAHAIFKSYDFHINMAAYDFMTDEFVLHDYFMTSIAARKLTFNPGTRYPIMSTLRVSKYLERGYTISKKEMFKIGLAIANLNIDSWETLEDQLSGFYGIDVSNMFDRSVPFDIDTAIDMIDSVHELVPDRSGMSPTMEQLFFSIMGNPFSEQRIFFKRMLANDDGTYSNLFDRSEVYHMNEPVTVEKRPFKTDFEEVKNDGTNRWGFGLTHDSKIGIFVLEGEHRMRMGYTDLELTGSVKLIAVKNQEKN